MTKCKCKQTPSQATDRHQLNGIRESTLIQRQFTPSNKMNKMSVTVGLAAKCPSPHPSIKGTRTVTASTSNSNKEQLNCNSSSFRRKQRSTVPDNTSPDEEDDHIANGHHIAILSDDNDDDNLGDDEENDTDYGTDNSSESDNNLENYLKITIPSDCRLKQSITPTNSPQSQSIQHSPHHAISVLSSILAKYETSGYIEQHQRKRDEFIWNRQINSERTSPRIMRQNTTDVPVKSRRNNCYCCVQSSSSASSTKNPKKLYHQHTTTNHYMAANLKSRTLSLPQCSFTDDFDTNKVATMCSDVNCRCIHVQSAIKTKSTKNDVQCNCSALKLSTNVSDVLETTC